MANKIYFWVVKLMTDTKNIIIVAPNNNEVDMTPNAMPLSFRRKLDKDFFRSFPLIGLLNTTQPTKRRTTYITALKTKTIFAQSGFVLPSKPS